MGMNVYPACDCGANIFDWGGFPYPCSMIVDQISLKLFYLLIVQDNLREFANASVHSIHNLVGLNFLLQHFTADNNTLQSFVMDFHFFPVTSNLHQFFNRQS